MVTKSDKKMTEVRIQLDDYTTRVLDVVKGKYGLKNRSEALQKFARECGDEFVEPPVSQEYLEYLDHLVEDHMKKYGFRSMNMEEVDELLGIED